MINAVLLRRGNKLMLYIIFQKMVDAANKSLFAEEITEFGWAENNATAEHSDNSSIINKYYYYEVS